MGEEQTPSGIPTEYLEAYPFIAFVLLVARGTRPVDQSSPVDNTSDVEIPHSNSQYGSVISDSGEAPDAHSTSTLDEGRFNTFDSAPLSGLRAPALLSGPRLLWANQHWWRLAQGRDMHEVLGRRASAALNRWVEGERAVGTEPTCSACLELQIGYTGQVVDLVKTIHSISPNNNMHTFAIITATGPGRTSSKASLSRHEKAPHRNVGHNTSPEKPLAIMIPHRLRPQPEVPHHNGFHKSVQNTHCRVLLEEMDWSSTSIGPRDSWPKEIRTLVKITMSSFTMDCVFIGPELLMVYNQHYSVLVAHPQAFGRPLSKIWEQLWDSLEPMFARVMAGEPLYRENDLLLHERDDRGRFVERYQTYCLLPILDDNGISVGVYNASSDSTPNVLAERRLKTTHDLVQQMSQVRTSRDFYSAISEVLEQNPADAPFVICYSVVNEASTKHTGHSIVVNLELESNVGVPDGHAHVPVSMTCTLSQSVDEDDGGGVVVDMPNLPKLNMDGSPKHQSQRLPSTRTRRREVLVETNPSAWPIARALATRQCIVVDGCSELVMDFQLRQWDKLPDMAVIIPIISDHSENSCPPSAVLILGLNRFRPLDTEYNDWIQAIRGHLTSALDSITALEEEIHWRTEQEKLERAKATWFRGSAAEFQTPLDLIAAPLDDLQDTDLSPAQRPLLTLALRNARRLQGLVSSLIDITRMEAGHVMTQFIPTDLGDFTEQLLAIFEPAIERLGILSALCVEYHEESTNVDPKLLEMVISHLVVTTLNTATHGVITVDLKFYDAYAILEVANICLKIPSTRTDLSMALEHWTPSQSEGEQAGGIGLALACQIINLHGGEIWSATVTPLEGDLSRTGTVISAKLPLDIVASEDVVPQAAFGLFARQMAREVVAWTKVEDHSASLDPQHSISSTEGLMFERSDILLVVDNNADVREYTRNLFMPFCTVMDAASGADALLLMQSMTPDLVLCDLLMRPMGGLELLAELRGRPATRFVPVLLLSASADDRSRVEAYMAGVDDYLIKPVRSKELLLRAHLHMQMGKKRAKLEKLFAEQLLEVERRRREAEESKQHQEFLVDLISHEIRTPVSAILQCSSLVRENLLALTQQLRFSREKGFQPSTSLLADLEDDLGALDSIYQCGLVQERIAGDVLSLAGIQRDMLSFHDVEVNVTDMTRKVVSVFGNEARMKRIELEMVVGKTFDTLGIQYIKTDPVRLGQVITNLISNAIRFTAQSVIRKVSVQLEAAWEPPLPGSCALPGELSTKQMGINGTTDPVYIYISVSDTGPGIKESEQAVLFHSFHQGNKMIHTRYGGSGLGLFICKKLLGGGIEVRSVLGQGTTFRFFIKAAAMPRLPPEPVESAPEEAPPLVARSSEPLPSPPLAPELRGRAASLDTALPLHVLIVEDNIINQTVLKRQLLKAKFTCDVADDGQAALIAIHEAHRKSRHGDKETYDVILMDLEMPIMDGLTAVRHIREAEASAALHPQLVIALTGNARQGQLEQALAAGMDDVIVKPYRLPELISKLQQSVAQFRHLSTRSGATG